MATTLTLAQLRTAAKQRADMENSTFVSDSEWNSYLNQSAFELYDLLVTLYEDYYIQAPLTINTTGEQQYALPDDFYKMRGVDLGLSNSQNAYVSLRKIDFEERNKYFYPQLNTTYLGYFNLRYRVFGNTLFFVPAPSAGQFIRIWYIPTYQTMDADGDELQGVSGWTEYVIVDAAIKALQKEESDCQLLVGQKMALKKRIEESAMNRDAGQPDTIASIRSRSDRWGGYGDFGGNFGGF